MLDEKNRRKLEALGNGHVLKRVEEAIGLCKPERVRVVTDSQDDIDYIRELTLKTGEEGPLAMKGHTVHFDGYYDQARDKSNTKYLLPEGSRISRYINSTEREAGLREVLGLLEGSMRGKEMLVRFFCLGPLSSKFSIPALQITDSAYVCHSEDILYRKGYGYFKNLGNTQDFFFLLHSAGRLENGVCAEIEKRRIYIDMGANSVYSVNNQYAGNSVGLKKIAMRLAIRKASQEGWMTEHMFIMGVLGRDRNGNPRKTYFTGAFPSACGKTSTAMIPGQTIVADDIAYLRAWDDGSLHAANVEQGIFGIIQDVNPRDDPVIFKALTTPRELIISNVLVLGGKPYWLGMGQELPDRGINYSGEWYRGKKGPDGKEIPPANKNARYTIRLRELDNLDQEAENPEGVPVGGFIFGGRDSDTSPPVAQSLNWVHGTLIAAGLESETTSATLGRAGVRAFNPMANLDFLSIPLGQYIQDYLRMGEKLKRPPLIFSVNYFLREGDKYLNGMLDKKVWLLWMEGRIHKEFEGIKTPIGYIPKYQDLKKLFRQALQKDYSREDYDRQFVIRVGRLLEKFQRIGKIYSEEENIPEEFAKELESQKRRLEQAGGKSGKEGIPPSGFE